MSLPISERSLASIREGNWSYYGEVIKDDGEIVPDGYGIEKQPEEEYKGQYESGEKHGFGQHKIFNKTITGFFNVDAKLGTIIYQDGHEYKGAISGFVPHGSGIMKYNNGDEYKGNFQNGQEHGWGTRVWTDKGKFTGLWVHGLPVNRLHQFWNFFATREIFAPEFIIPSDYLASTLSFNLNGIKYNGSIKEGKLHGHGKLIFPNGDWYEGGFVNGDFEGEGKLHYHSENITYEGTFKKGLFTQKGKISFEGGSFVGNFKAGKAFGEGIVIYDNGDFFKGEFFADSPDKGKMHWSDLGVYEGLWEDGAPAAGEFRGAI